MDKKVAHKPRKYSTVAAAGPAKTAAASSMGVGTAFDCNQCGRSFSSQANLMKHNVVHTDSSVSCKTCLREFKMPCHLARHFCNALLPDRQWALGSAQQPQLQPQPHQSDDLESEGSHECDLCHRTFQYAGNLTVHKRFCQRHGGPAATRDLDESEEAQPQMILLDCEDEVHECGLCNETFADKEALDRHSADCSLKPAAPTAAAAAASSMPSSSSSAVAAVAMSAAAAAARAGPQYQRSWAGSGAQPERERIPCPNCGKTYCRKDVLEAHMKTSCRGAAAAVAAGAASGPPVKRPRQDAPLAAADRALSFRCELCPSQFSSSLGLVVHRSKCHPQFYGPNHRRAVAAAAAAAGGGEFRCESCHRGFAKAAHLSKHRLLCPELLGVIASAAEPTAAHPHGGDQGPLSLPNRCPRCPRAFLTAGRLQDHVLAVHGPAIGGPAVQTPPAAAAADAVADNGPEDEDGDGGLLLDDADADDCDDDGEEATVATEEAMTAAAAAVDAEEAMVAEHSEADAYLCSECDRSYPTFDLLNRHLMEAHEIDSVTPEAPVACAPGAQEEQHAVLQPMQLTAALTGARKRKSTPVSSMC